jgi:DNA-binding LacI/PurR family transcriptional regulator
MQPVALMARKSAGSRIQTIEDIARMAAVSKSTVSRALNDSPLIARKTKQRIQAIAHEHQFRIDASARRLSLKQSRTIAFVTHGCYTEFSCADLFTLEILGGISVGLHANGYDLLLANVDPRDTTWARDYLDSGRADGFILIMPSRKQIHIRTLLEMQAPFIIWGVPPARTSCCSVTGDNVRGGRLATERLIEIGRKRIAFLGGPPEEVEVQQRHAGYREALQTVSLPVDSTLAAYGDFSDRSGAAAMLRLLEQAPDLDGVFVSGDLMAIAAMKTLRERGRRVPDDVAVVGYDDLSIAQHAVPPLTTVSQNVPLAGKLLAENLLQYIKTGIVTNVSVSVHLVVRESA